MKARTVLSLLTVTSAVFLAGCANHQVVNSEASSEAAAVNSVAIFSVTEDLSARSEFENAFSATFDAEGITAHSTYEYSPDSESLDNPKIITDAHEHAGADSLLTIEVVSARSEGAQKTSNVMEVTWWTALALDEPAIRYAADVGSIVSTTEAGKYQLRVSLWDTVTGKRMWSMDTQSYSNGNTSKDATKLAQTVVQELRTNGLVL